MNSPKNLAIAVLALAVAGGAFLAWKQHLELIALRAAAMNNDERADWQKRLWAAEKRAKDLTDELAALRSRNAGDGTGAAADDGGQPGQNGRGRRGGPGGGPRPGIDAMMSFMDKPEVQRLMAIQQKGQLDGRYAALFKSLNLSPEQLDKFKSLLVEKQTVMQDVLAAARAQGINLRDDPDALRKMIADTQAEVDTGIRSTLGDDGFAKYQSYQTTQSQRTVVNQLQQSLSYTNAPLTDAQADALVQILAQTAPKSAGGDNPKLVADGNVTVTVGPPGGGAGPGPGGAMFFSVGNAGLGFIGGPAPITNEAIAAAQSVLSPPQVQGLEQLQQQQQAQQQLQQTIRQTMETQRGGGGGGAAPASPAAPASGG